MALVEHEMVKESDERMCCPRCGNEIDYNEDEDEWLCAECDLWIGIWSEDVRCP